MRRILLTGATGFIGRHCLPILVTKDLEVHAVSLEPITEKRTDVHWHQADLLDAQQVARLMADVGPSDLLHFAWYTVPGEYWNSSENLSWVRASLELLQAFAQEGGHRVVMAGTCAEYDWRYGYCSENLTPLAPKTLYGACKHSLQAMVTSFAEHTGLSAAWGRIFLLYGPHEHPGRLVSSVIRAILKGEPARCTHGNQMRDFLYVEDVADAFVELLESDITGAVNIASGFPLTVKDMVYRIAEKLDGKSLVSLGAVSASPSEPPLVVADVRLLKNGLGWLPTFDLDRGLDRTIAWWQKSLVEKGK